MALSTVRRALAVAAAVLAIGGVAGTAAWAHSADPGTGSCGWLESFPPQPAPCPTGTPSPGDGGEVGYDVTTGQTTAPGADGKIAVQGPDGRTEAPGSAGPGSRTR